jgi:hypothetical protein
MTMLIDRVKPWQVIALLLVLLALAICIGYLLGGLIYHTPKESPRVSSNAIVEHVTPYYTSANNMAVIDEKKPKLTTGTQNTALGYKAIWPKTTNGKEEVFYGHDDTHWWPKENHDK